MLKPFNKTLSDDIKKLKELLDSGKKIEYRSSFNKLMQRHGISRSTVYGELRKDTPGSYKRFGRAPANISKQELDLVTGCIMQRKSNDEAIKTLTLEMGFTYTIQRLIRAREILIEAAKELKQKTEPVVQPFKDYPDINERMAVHKLHSHQLNLEDEAECKKYNNPERTRKFFYILASLDTSDPKGITRLQYNDMRFDVSNSVIKESLDHIAASAHNDGKNIRAIMRFDLETELLKKLHIAKKYNYSCQEIRQLTAIYKSFVQLDAETSPGKSSSGGGGGGYTLEDIFRAVTHFSPAVTKEEVTAIVSQI